MARSVTSTDVVFAHSAPEGSGLAWEPLIDHLQRVATGRDDFLGAAGFAAKFDSRDWGNLAAMWHDIGKYAPQFQSYLRNTAAGGPRERVDHSTAGALLAWNARGIHPLAAAVAFAVAGHHAGLPDLGNLADDDQSGTLLARLRRLRPETTDAIKMAPADLLGLPIPTPPAWMRTTADQTQQSLRDSLFIRMLFSCLVDADRLATAAYANQCAPQFVPSPISIADLANALDQAITTLSHRRPGGPTPVDAVRATLLADCRDAAAYPPGLFSLVAPTGAGKTLSSMAFALRHAQTHGLERIIYALPFTSVTEQNAAVFRNAFASLGRDDIVIEHHSAFESRASDSAQESRSADARERQRLAATENWDAPVIVTTNVQLLESLFAAAATPCRKLHRIARSVVILDEAQSLPVDLLKPTLAALQELAAHYSTSVVLCSATMPAVFKRPGFDIGLPPGLVRPIVKEERAMSVALRRARVSHLATLSDAALVDRLATHDRVLAIVNTRKHAAQVFRLLQDRYPDALHLSASMCPAHRSDRVAEIKRRLADPASPCRVVSTQVVEAGVDIDFPIVYRAMAGLDSIVQSAGRCNREGKLPIGDVFTFDPDPIEYSKRSIPPSIRQAIQAANEVLCRDDAETTAADAPPSDPLDLATIEHYFRQLYWTKGGPEPKWDGWPGSDGRRSGITEMLGQLKLRSAADAYSIIDDGATTSIVVPYTAEGTELCQTLLESHSSVGFVPKALVRASQRYTVSIRPYVLERLLQRNACIQLEGGPWVLVGKPGMYDLDIGLTDSDDGLFMA